MAKKILSALICVLLIATSVVVAGAATVDKASTGATTKYATASQELDEKYGYNGTDLGATYSPESTTFKVWAPTATKVILNRFATGSDSEPGAKKLGTAPMMNNNGVWSTTIEGDIKNTYYTYSITATDVLGANSKTYETQDVYSVATGVNGERSMVCDLDSTDPEGWDKDAHVVLENNTDSYVWEVHVKDFSYNPNSGVSEANRGKYTAFAETGTTLNNEGEYATCIDYLKELGVTTVQINPFYDYGSVAEDGSDAQFNWGYDPVNYNVPEGSYSTNPFDGNVRINECKQMVKALHDAGISVVMDVVYNHVYDAAKSPFTKTVPTYYFRMKNDGGYSNGSGCGNETASERLMFRNYMIQSCLYWVNEYHIDGFRFDLMALHDTETMNLIRDELDKIDPRLTMWGEGWTGGSSVYPDTTCTGEKFQQALQAKASLLNERIAFFNDGIRDGLKGNVFQKKGAGWLQGDDGAYTAVASGMIATSTWGKGPTQFVTYDSCHDNQTLWDRLADSQDYTEFRQRDSKLASQSKLAGAMLNMAKGITFTLAGEEMGRSKDNDENSYASSATLNMLDWQLVKTNADIVSYYKGTREIRTHFSPLRSASRTGDYTYTVIKVDPTTRPVEGTNMMAKIESQMYAALWTNKTEGEWEKLLVLSNNDVAPYSYKYTNDDTEWVIIADGLTAGVKKLGEVNDGNFIVPAISTVIAVDKASFEKVALQSDLGAVKVQAVNAVTDTLIDAYGITGKIGNKYVVEDPAVGIEYELKSVDGDKEGLFAAEDKNITMTYGYYVPESVKKDINGDGKVNISDATFVQRVIAGAVKPSDDQNTLADCNLDGTVDINDVTMFQKNLVDANVATGTVTTHFIDKETNEELSDAVVFKGRVGESYTAKSATMLGYNLSDSETETTVAVPYGNKDVTFYYVGASSDVTLHVKHSSGSGYSPYLWIWGSKNGTDSGTSYHTNKTWPGDVLTVKDADGWYNKDFSVRASDDSYSFIVSDDGAPQSVDCKGFTQNELWIVIDDTKTGVALNVYDVNPDTNAEAAPVAQF